MKENKDFKILIADDEMEYQRVFSYILTKAGYHTITCSSGSEALQLLEKNEIDLVMTDLKMPGMDGLELIRQIKKSHPQIEILVVTAFGTIESAVQAIKYGATGYFVKSSEPEALLLDVDRMARIKTLERSNQILRQQASSCDQFFMESSNPRYLELLNTCEKAAATNINVLILGESGVGKEVIANYIHKRSDRCHRHFIPVNCQAFPENIVESELFGHEKGAFTGASVRRTGRFEEANYGTLFLDEIGDLPASTQGKLLRALETRSIERIGSNFPIDLDIRLISATNKDLNAEIRAGRFREDLLYRINTLTITVPPLRERKEDLPGLIHYFVKKIQAEQKKKITGADPLTAEYLLNYDYPGNVRELRNILERMIALSDDGILHGQGNLSLNSSFSAMPAEAKSPGEFLCLHDARANFEKTYIETVLKQTGGNVTAAADILKITKRQLWNKIAEYQIQR